MRDKKDVESIKQLERGRGECAKIKAALQPYAKADPTPSRVSVLPVTFACREQSLDTYICMLAEGIDLQRPLLPGSCDQVQFPQLIHYSLGLFVAEPKALR